MTEIDLGFDLFERLHEMADEQERENNMAHAILDLAGAPVREIIAAVVREFGDCDPVAVMRNAARRTLTAQDALDVLAGRTPPDRKVNPDWDCI